MCISCVSRIFSFLQLSCFSSRRGYFACLLACARHRLFETCTSARCWLPLRGLALFWGRLDALSAMTLTCLQLATARVGDYKVVRNLLGSCGYWATTKLIHGSVMSSFQCCTIVTSNFDDFQFQKRWMRKIVTFLHPNLNFVGVMGEGEEGSVVA